MIGEYLYEFTIEIVGGFIVTNALLLMRAVFVAALTGFIFSIREALRRAAKEGEDNG